MGLRFDKAVVSAHKILYIYTAWPRLLVRTNFKLVCITPWACSVWPCPAACCAHRSASHYGMTQGAQGYTGTTIPSIDLIGLFCTYKTYILSCPHTIPHMRHGPDWLKRLLVHTNSYLYDQRFVVHTNSSLHPRIFREIFQAARFVGAMMLVDCVRWK